MINKHFIKTLRNFKCAHFGLRVLEEKQNNDVNFFTRLCHRVCLLDSLRRVSRVVMWPNLPRDRSGHDNLWAVSNRGLQFCRQGMNLVHGNGLLWCRDYVEGVYDELTYVYWLQLHRGCDCFAAYIQ